MRISGVGCWVSSGGGIGSLHGLESEQGGAVGLQVVTLLPPNPPPAPPHEKTAATTHLLTSTRCIRTRAARSSRDPRCTCTADAKKACTSWFTCLMPARRATSQTFFSRGA